MNNTDSTVASNRGQSLFLHPKKGHLENVNIQEVILSIKLGRDDVVFLLRTVSPNVTTWQVELDKVLM